MYLRSLFRSARADEEHLPAHRCGDDGLAVACIWVPLNADCLGANVPSPHAAPRRDLPYSNSLVLRPRDHPLTVRGDIDRPYSFGVAEEILRLFVRKRAKLARIRELGDEALRRHVDSRPPHARAEVKIKAALEPILHNIAIAAKENIIIIALIIIIVLN